MLCRWLANQCHWLVFHRSRRYSLVLSNDVWLSDLTAISIDWKWNVLLVFVKDLVYIVKSIFLVERIFSLFYTGFVDNFKGYQMLYFSYHKNENSLVLDVFKNKILIFYIECVFILQYWSSFAKHEYFSILFFSKFFKLRRGIQKG